MIQINKKKLIKITLIALPAIALVIAGALWYASKDAPSATAAWWNDNWAYRKAIVINHNKVGTSSPITNFPVLVSLTDSSLSSHAQEDGDDFKFVLEGSGEVLSHEIEKYASSTGELVAWVKVPELSSTEDTVIYMYYGNAAAGNQEDAENVWDDNYKMIQHANEASGTQYDSTRFNNDTIVENATVQASSTGKIDGANELNGSDNGMTVGPSPELTGMSGLTVSAWVWADTKSDYMKIVEKASSTASNQEYQYSMRLYTGADQKIEFEADGSGGSDGYVYSNDPCPTGEWVYVVGTYDSSVPIVKMFVNGVEQDDTDSTLSGNVPVYNTPVQIGASRHTQSEEDGTA